MVRLLRWIATLLIVGLAATAALTFAMPLLSAARIVFGILLLLILPGLAWSFALFPDRELDAMERTALSFGFSLAIMPLVIFGLKRLGVATTALSILIQVLAVTVIAIGVYLIRYRPAPRPASTTK